MLDKVKKTIKKHNLMDIGDKVIVAVSGGPDSIALLHILHSLREEFKLQLYAAHLNHNFRGIEAQMDAQYVAKFCEELKILSFIKSMDVPKYAKEQGVSAEEAGRILRYEFFGEVVERVGATKIAVAHNQNDQAETVLMRLLRGTGIQGLTAIHHERGKIIRPLLDVNRKEIEEYCAQYNLSPRIDETNLEPIYHRNKIRLELIPYIQEHYNPSIIESLAKTAEILKKDNEFMEEVARDAYNQVKLEKAQGCLALSIEGINKIHPALQSRIFRLATEELVGKKEGLEYKHIQGIIELLQKNETGKKILLAMGIVVKTSYNKIIFTIKDEEEEANFYYELRENGHLSIDEIKGEIFTKVVMREDMKGISRDKYVKCFDYDKVKEGLNVRNRREGDRFWPLGLVGSKKLKDFYIDYKIERDKRNEIPLVCDGNEIMWVVGYRISEKYKVTEETSRILTVEYKKMLKES
ncbi:tRNA lysidine(34) synthetase TilS [Clostridium formicaceticum]|uniref:tRNA(Ile)-lysidine synthase n=1 Tax=Clostridium formicaceticum TaxID=1497 RepID=A0AAC9RQH8_9CLOT|nr:tRNA lysidine(34) synthetase TilS [Clostridium formicaceticum]AOY75161.1 tRNA lysidine(34) synthetase TilS [Clostridium formicaceticum]ARE89587.1 tRNA(Ile)-lysidine synthase [Clostridium formicaceticum]